jgi:hypothetical protein
MCGLVWFFWVFLMAKLGFLKHLKKGVDSNVKLLYHTASYHPSMYGIVRLLCTAPLFCLSLSCLQIEIRDCRYDLRQSRSKIGINIIANSHCCKWRSPIHFLLQSYWRVRWSRLSNTFLWMFHSSVLQSKQWWQACRTNKWDGNNTAIVF